MSFRGQEWAIRQRDVNSVQKSILMALGYRDNHDAPHGCYPSLRQIAEDTRYSVTTVKTALKQLDGWKIRRERTSHETKKKSGKRKGRKVTYFTSTRYFLVGCWEEGEVGRQPTKGVGRETAKGGSAPGLGLVGSPSKNGDISYKEPAVNRNPLKSAPLSPRKRGDCPTTTQVIETLDLNLGGGQVWVRKPKNRRLCTQAQSEAMVGTRPEDWVAFFHRQGFEAGIVAAQKEAV